MKKFAFKTTSVFFYLFCNNNLKQLLKAEQSTEKLMSNYNNFNAQTGKLLIKQSMGHLEMTFNDLKEIFIQKNSLKYAKFKVRISN